MNDSEKLLVERIVNYEADVKNILAYIKENYDIDGTFDDETKEVKLVCNVAENALMLAAAKEYIEETLGEDLVRVVF